MCACGTIGAVIYVKVDTEGGCGLGEHLSWDLP